MSDTTTDICAAIVSLGRSLIDEMQLHDGDDLVSMYYRHVRTDEQDPWTAGWGRFKGSGQTAEMALLDLKASMIRVVNEAIDYEERRVKKANEKLALLKGFVQ